MTANRKFVVNDALNDFICVEISQTVARILDRINHYHGEDEPEPTEDSKVNLKPVPEPDNDSINQKYLADNYHSLLNLYWDGKSERDIAFRLGTTVRDVKYALKRFVPIDFIYEKYNSGMLPSRIARLVKVGLTTNQVRRILKMNPVLKKVEVKDVCTDQESK